ncbi:ASCH domain-containing protein [Rhizobium sp. BT04]|uniref:ASCH domain-containing protein n=1 Tax=Rhizobium sp. BT04 TaxID=3045157 RepID=UPI0024B3D6CB|nr:ASCH domain-containing protein [Rhizobium sp. BT04]
MTTIYTGDISTLPDLALSTRQPWAHAIVNGWKDIENRKWNTRHRGLICIHASAYNARNIAEDWQDFAGVITDHPDLQPNHPAHDLVEQDMTFGAIIGVARIVDATQRHSSPWFFGKYGFVLEDQQILAEPIPLKGALGLFEWRPRLAGISPAAKTAPAGRQGSLF